MHFLEAYEETVRMITKGLKVFMLVIAASLMASAFVPVSKPNPPRSLMLLGAGLVSMAALTRRHFADEE